MYFLHFFIRITTFIDIKYNLNFIFIMCFHFIIIIFFQFIKEFYNLNLLRSFNILILIFKTSLFENIINH